MGAGARRPLNPPHAMGRGTTRRVVEGFARCEEEVTPPPSCGRSPSPGEGPGEDLAGVARLYPRLITLS
jgi:hypothetical protein